LDGQLARGLKRGSKEGEFLDIITDRVGTIVFITTLFSIGSFVQSNLLMYGSILLFIIKMFHLIFISKIYYWKEQENQKESKSGVFSGNEGLNRIGVGKILFIFNKIFKPIFPRRCVGLFGQFERYILSIIVPLLMVYFGLNGILIIYCSILILFHLIFFCVRLKKLLKLDFIKEE
jgi:hypothetical protein